MRRCLTRGGAIARATLPTARACRRTPAPERRPPGSSTTNGVEPRTVRACQLVAVPGRNPSWRCGSRARFA